MLTRLFSNTLLTRFVVGVFLGLQVWIICTQQLFGDEAFYWLESQYLSLSYSELPGWTAWMIRLSTDLFGQSYFAVRLLSFLAYLSIFYASWLLCMQISEKNKSRFNGLILLSIPLFMLVATMALPDIWLVVFVVWISYFLSKAISHKLPKYWVILGLLMACSINVHLRMWIWLFFAGLSFLYFFYNQKNILKSAFLITFPLALLGLIPILIYNYQHDFVLFAFQLNDRHPWEFQASNSSFMLAQVVVITPIVLYLWFSNISKIRLYANQQPMLAWILVTAFLHWLLYVLLSLFADGLRTTIHWSLISYVPVLAISGLLSTHKKLVYWALITGGLTSLALLVFIGLNNKIQTNLQARLFDNSQGWHELSQVVSRIQKDQNINPIITDYFMTAAELAFELDKAKSILVLPHAKNVKHGREKQLEIMDILLADPQSYLQEALLIVEDSTLKLKDKAKYYAQLCVYFKQVNYLESVNFIDNNKQFHIFKVSNKQESNCEIPPLFYIQHSIENNQIKIKGWVVYHQVGIKSLALIADNDIEIVHIKNENRGIQESFPEIEDPNRPNNGFEISIPYSQFSADQLRIKATGIDGRIYLSKIYYLD